MKSQKLTVAPKLALFAAITGVISTTYAQDNQPTFRIEEKILTGSREIADTGRGPRPIAAVADGNGMVSRFVANELIYADSDDKLPAFLARYNAQEIAVTGVPTRANGLHPPASLKMHVLRLDPTRVSVSNLSADAAQLGMHGLHKFSSVSAMQLAAAMAREAATGMKVSLNFVSEAADYPTSSTEQADGNGVSDAYQWPEFVNKAWEFVSEFAAENGLQRRIILAVIDGGFWLNANGVPCDLVTPDATCGLGTVSLGVSDLPSFPVQYNTINGSPYAGGPSVASCTNGAPCPWHGNKTVSVALATLSNGGGAAGTGGQVADPMLFRSDLTDSSVVDAIFNATGTADIINMSFSGTCNDWCGAGHSVGGVNVFMDAALDSGALLVAAAGNNSIDAGQQWPCQFTSGNGNKVYCVGALNSSTDANGYFVSNTGSAAPYSNFGLAVNIWAPTNIHAMPDGGSNGNLTVHTGTSASTPYVAGVAAMLKAVNPSLDANGLKGILGNAPFTAGTSIYNSIAYTDPKVSLVLSPYKAVVAAAGGYHLKPVLHITSPQDGAVIQVSAGVPINFTATAKDVNDGAWPAAMAPTYKGSPVAAVAWTSDVDGTLAESSNDNSGGTSMPYDFTYSKEGLRHVTASVTNSAGYTTKVTIAVTIKFNHVTPAPVITWPTPNLTVAPGTYTVTGYAKSTDPGALGNFDCSRLKWNGSVAAVAVPNSNGQCEAQMSFTTGIQKVTLSATDQFGDTGSTTATVNGVAQSAMSVQILNPTKGSYDIVTINSSTTIGLSGNAAPLIPNSTVNYSWYWYLTSAGAATEKPIATGQNATWKVLSSAVCQGPGTQNVTVVLKVSDLRGAVITSGSASTNIQLVCENNN
jgi:hypothetical protein